MEVIFYSEFSKRRNSTKNPESSGAISFSVTKEVKLKGECSRISPKFFVGDVSGYVYCKAWGWYYFISNISYDINGAQYIECDIDVLGTWKEAILNTKAFVKYSTSNYDKYVVDSRIARRADTSVVHSTHESIFTDEEPDNEFVLFITIGGEYSSTAYDGGYNYYAFSETGWNDFCAYLCNADFEDNIKKIFTDVVGGLISARRVPIKTSELPLQEVSSIRVGRAEIPYPAWKLSARYIHKSFTLSVPSYPATFEHWHPYMRVKLYIPYIGPVDIPTDQYGQDILVDYVVDLTSGQMDVNLCRHNINNKLMSLTSEVGGQLPTSVNNVNMLKVAANGASAIGALAAGNAVGAVAEAASAVSTGLTDHISSKGSFGAGRSEILGSDFVLYKIMWQRVSNFHEADFYEICGGPNYTVRSLEGLEGYVQTIDFSVDISAPDVVKAMINESMDSGVYLE